MKSSKKTYKHEGIYKLKKNTYVYKKTVLETPGILYKAGTLVKLFLDHDYEPSGRRGLLITFPMNGTIAGNSEIIASYRVNRLKWILNYLSKDEMLAIQYGLVGS